MQKKSKQWNEELLDEFMKKDLEYLSIDVENGYNLILSIEHSKKTDIPYIVKEFDGLLSWLGAPVGFKVYLWWMDVPRKINADEWPSKRSVNGGWTTLGNNEIFIYRAEEWDRVLIHETIHALQWDWAMPEKPLRCWNFSNTDTVYPHLFEAWTELYAEWLWCGWHNQSWIKQREWQTKQAVQILARRPYDWEEDTNIFAYYVLKTCLAPYIEFLWSFGNGNTKEEFANVLCGLVTPNLQALKTTAKSTLPIALSMRMSQKIEPHEGSK